MTLEGLSSGEAGLREGTAVHNYGPFFSRGQIIRGGDLTFFDSTQFPRTEDPSGTHLKKVLRRRKRWR